MTTTNNPAGQERLLDRWIQGRCKALERERPELSDFQRYRLARAQWREQEQLHAIFQADRTAEAAGMTGESDVERARRMTR